MTAYKDLLFGIRDFVNNNVDDVSEWRGTQDASGAQAWFEANYEAAMRGEETSAGGSTAQAAPVKAATASSAPVGGLAAAYNKEVAALLAPLGDLTKALGSEPLTKCVDNFCLIVNWVPKVLAMQQTFKKPTDLQPLFEKYKALVAEVDEIARKDRKVPVQHAGLVNDALALFACHAWEANGGSVDYMKELHDALPFRGNKILKMDKPADTNWVNAFMAVCTAMRDFYVEKWFEIH